MDFLKLKLILLLWKSYGAGMPVGAFASNKEIMGHLSPDGKVYQAGTFMEIQLQWQQDLQVLEK